MDLLETTISAAVTLVAAFAGSWSAFKLADSEKARKTVRDQVAAINRAQFVLIQQLNTLKVLQSKMIEPKRADPLRMINMRPTPPVLAPASRLSVDELLFLLETEDRDFPFHLTIEQQRFDVTIQTINERSRLHVDELQPSLAAAGIEEGDEYSPAALRELLDDNLLVRLQRATDTVVEHVDITIESGASLVEAFYKAMKARFPKETIIRLAPEAPSNDPPSASPR